MKLSLTKSIIFVLVILQCTNVAYSQQQGQSSGSNNEVSAQQETQQQQQQQQQQTSDTPAATSAPVVESSTTPAVTTTTEAQQATTTTTTQAPIETTTDSTVAPTSTTRTAAPTSDVAVPTSSSKANDNTSSQTKQQPQTSTTVDSNGSTVATVITPSASAQPTQSSNANMSNDGPSSNKTAIIAGSVVGGLVGIALIAGLLTWMNRRGGCTSRTRRRDVQEDFSNDNDYKMTENAAGLGAIAGGGSGAMHSSDNLPPPSPFQHARRFVPPTSNPTGYMNLQDEEYGYHQNANVGAGYQPQQYQDFNAGGVYHDGSHPDYNQDYQQQEYYNHEYSAHDYSADGSVTGSHNGAYQQQQYYNHPPGSNVTSPTLTNSAPLPPADVYRQQLKPDQVEQKPNVA
jgi:hypothetical protein